MFTYLKKQDAPTNKGNIVTFKHDELKKQLTLVISYSDDKFDALCPFNK